MNYTDGACCRCGVERCRFPLDGRWCCAMRKRGINTAHAQVLNLEVVIQTVLRALFTLA
jgi:hypothetical protein